MKMTRIYLAVFSVLLTSYICDAYKILLVFPVPGRSHAILGDGYVKHLLAAGHEVTYITPFPKPDPPPNLHQVDVSANKKVFNEDTMHIKLIMDHVINMKDRDFLFYLMNNISTATMKDVNVQKLLRDPKQHFDVVIAEWMFSEMYSAIPAVFGCPLIWSSSLEPHWMVTSLIDEPLNPAYNAHFLHSRRFPLTFLERIEELWTQILWMYKRNYAMFDIQKATYESDVVPILKEKGLPIPSFDDLRYNASLMLGNSHVSLGRPTRIPQNYKSIGGYHVNRKVAPLPEDLQTIMDRSENGVIYFSMGSNMKSKDLPDELKMGILRIFSELNQTVIWKFEELLPNIPKNVHIRSWAPQPSILSHRNCKLFITHGGLLSTTEAIHFGVPIIGIPVFADQFTNVDIAVYKGYGQRVDLSYTMVNELKSAIVEMIGNTQYRETVKELSKLYHDRPLHPSVELVYWVEHVIRTKGAPHLKSLALHVPWYQKIYLDFVGLILAIIFAVKMLLSSIRCRVRIKKGKSAVEEKTRIYTDGIKVPLHLY